MKQLIILLLMLAVVSVGFSQVTSELNGQPNPQAERARLFKTYTTFTATSDDTTGWVTVNLPNWTSDPLLNSEVWLIGFATDSIMADVNIIGRNGTLTNKTCTYADSIVIADSLSGFTATNTVGIMKTIVLKGATLQRLAGCTQFKVGTVFRATGNGTTAGRTFKWYVGYIYP